MQVDIQFTVALLVYGLTPILIVVAGWLAWRKLRPRCRRYGADLYDDRITERKKFWGYE